MMSYLTDHLNLGFHSRKQELFKNVLIIELFEIMFFAMKHFIQPYTVYKRLFIYTNFNYILKVIWSFMESVVLYGSIDLKKARFRLKKMH